MKWTYHYSTTTDGRCYAYSYDDEDSSSMAIVEEVDPITRIPIKKESDYHIMEDTWRLW